MALIASSLSLLAIVAGMFLLAKTHKDNLSNSFKYISFFIVFVGFLNLLCSGAMFAAKVMMHCHHMEGGYHHGGKGGYHHQEGDRSYHMEGYHGNCGKGMRGMCGDRSDMCDDKGMCCDGGMMMHKGRMESDDDCCKDMSRKNMMMKKDSAVIKK